MYFLVKENIKKTIFIPCFVTELTNILKSKSFELFAV